MGVYVDEAIFEWRGRKWAHLFSPELGELHEFASSLGLRRGWFQDPCKYPGKVSWPHYDVTDTKRLHAIQLGAKALNRHQTVMMAEVVKHRYFKLPGTPFDVELAERWARKSPAKHEELMVWFRAELAL